MHELRTSIANFYADNNKPIPRMLTRLITSEKVVPLALAKLGMDIDQDIQTLSLSEKENYKVVLQKFVEYQYCKLSQFQKEMIESISRKFLGNNHVFEKNTEFSKRLSGVYTIPQLIKELFFLIENVILTHEVGSPEISSGMKKNYAITMILFYQQILFLFGFCTPRSKKFIDENFNKMTLDFKVYLSKFNSEISLKTDFYYVESDSFASMHENYNPIFLQEWADITSDKKELIAFRKTVKESFLNIPKEYLDVNDFKIDEFFVHLGTLNWWCQKLNFFLTQEDKWAELFPGKIHSRLEVYGLITRGTNRIFKDVLQYLERAGAIPLEISAPLISDINLKLSSLELIQTAQTGQEIYIIEQIKNITFGFIQVLMSQIFFKDPILPMENAIEYLNGVIEIFVMK